MTRLLSCAYCGARVPPLDAVYDDGPTSPAHPGCAAGWHLALRDLLRQTTPD